MTKLLCQTFDDWQIWKVESRYVIMSSTGSPCDDWYYNTFSTFNSALHYLNLEFL